MSRTKVWAIILLGLVIALLLGSENLNLSFSISKALRVVSSTFRGALLPPIIQQRLGHTLTNTAANVSMGRTPVYFISHGGPNIMEDCSYSQDHAHPFFA